MKILALLIVLGIGSSTMAEHNEFGDGGYGPDGIPQPTCTDLIYDCAFIR